MSIVKRYRPPWHLQVLEFVEVRKQFFVAQLHNLPAQLLAREELRIRSTKIKQLPFETCPIPSLFGIDELVTMYCQNQRPQ